MVILSRISKSEDAIQQSCYMWFFNQYPNLRGLLFHVPNGGSRNVVEAKNLKKIGVVAGVADLLLLYNSKVYCFELKTEKGSQSDSQKKWQTAVDSQDIPYFICRSLGEFQEKVSGII